MKAKGRSVNKRSVKRLRGAASPTSERNIAARLRQSQALSLRIGGATFSDIASALNYKTHSGAREAVLDALHKQGREKGQKLRAMERERWRSLWLAMFPLAQRGDVKAAGVCTRLLKRFAEMEGSDPPRRVRL